ncbi:hypothetical protein BGZ91_011620 [Linnemannia elongata]|nr:hypothetical protein BGZ91_011620 [Linnemannia elongata]KAG0064746.1 hypothetical protein BGZ90_002063 [Linnemannia elongata]
MPKGTSPSLASVPELLEVIGRYLTPPDLARCALTCRLWHHTLSPLLWETFDDSLYSWPSIMLALNSETDAGRQLKAWVDALFSKYGHHIRTLRVRHYYTVLVASECGGCTRLVSLQSFDFAEGLSKAQESGPGWCLETTRTVVPTVVESAIGVELSSWRSEADKGRYLTTARRFWMLLYLNSSTLRSLRLDKSLSKLCTLPSFDLLDNILTSLQNLKELSNTMYPTDVDRLLQQIPSLRSITGCPKRDTSSAVFNNVRFFDALMGMDLLTIRHYLTKFPNLDCLCLERLIHRRSMSQQQQQPIVDQDDINNVSFQLSEIRFTADDFTHNHSRLLFSWFPHLRHITLDRLNEYIAHIIVTYCRELETFRLLEKKEVFLCTLSADAAFVLLQGCPNLKVLDVYESQIRAESLLASPPWVCKKLETLRCLITGVSRLSEEDITTLNNLSVTGSNKNVFLTKQDRHALKTARETMGHQQRILERLAELKHLKVLELGFKRRKHHQYGRKEDYLYVDHYSDTLGLNMASGLGQLAALKNLEMFGFEGCYHEIDKPELDWMIKSWPRLRAMRGLGQNGVSTSRFEMRKTELRSYMQQIRGDIQQLGGK